MKIAIYCGSKGTTPETRRHMHGFLSQFFQGHYIALMNEKAILRGCLNNSFDYFFVPGGSTTRMLEELTPRGIRFIKDYVWHGGNYVGICAGAYLASGFVNFQTNFTKVAQRRPLRFFPGIQQGPYTGIYNLTDMSGFQCVKIDIEKENIHAFLNGGGFFLNTERYKNVEVIGRYEAGEACAVRCQVKKGKAYLLAVHLEYQPNLLKEGAYIKKTDIENLKRCNLQRFRVWRQILNI